ncbi:MAG: ubiquinol-cytochrome c reductase iron-sulfur subunit [bacterium]|nr:ubiquinol-cytochrome c reductase iron-sulfur subunit [bacterium]
MVDAPEQEKTQAPEAVESPRAAAQSLVRSPLRGEVSRRGILAAGWGALVAGTLGMVGAMTRFMFPNVMYEPPQEFKAGMPSEYGVDAVDTRYKAANGVWIVRQQQGFYVLSTVCTHLGCTPNWLSADEKFKCPCHGSGFNKEGIHIEGPAPRPLERYKVTFAEDGQLLIDKNTKYQEEKGQWILEGAYLPYVG